MKRGKFITFEGNEATGKTTQVRLLEERLLSEGYPICVVKEPGGTVVGDIVRDLFKDPVKGKGMCYETELLLMQASRAQLMYDVIKPALQNNKIVISDRFIDSTTVYQGFARGINQLAIDLTTELAVGSIKPDVTFVLQVPFQTVIKRINERKGLDRLEQEGKAFLLQVHEGFEILASLDPARIVNINGNRVVEEIHADIYNRVKKIYENS
jgi:dTMP kinase